MDIMEGVVNTKELEVEGINLGEDIIQEEVACIDLEEDIVRVEVVEEDIIVIEVVGVEHINLKKLEQEGKLVEDCIVS